MGVISDLPLMYTIACLFLGISYSYFLYRKEVLLTAKKLKQKNCIKMTILRKLDQSDWKRETNIKKD